MYQMLDKTTGTLARLMAYLGGGVLIAVVITTCLSISGRSLMFAGLGPIPCDFEVVEYGIGFAIFAFLPWCQYTRGHARVDLFTPLFGTLTNRIIDLIADLMMFGAAYLIAWRLWVGMMDKQRYFETSFILQLPVWQAYAAAVVGAIVFVIVAAFCVLRSLQPLISKSAGTTYEQH